MKKLLGIVFLGLLWSNLGYAGCRDDLKTSYAKNRKTENSNIVLEFKNTGSKEIRIIKYWVKDKENVKIIDKEPLTLSDYKMRYYVAPNETKKILITDHKAFMYGIKADYSCKYEKSYGHSESWFKWWYILVGLGVLVAIGVISDATSGGSKKTKKSANQGIDKENPPTISEQALINFISKVWSGRETLPITFWLYFIVLNSFISVGAGFASVYFESELWFIAPVLATLLFGVGVWNSSTNYQNLKLKNKQTYGWAIASKVAVVIAFVSMAGQIFVTFGGG